MRQLLLVIYNVCFLYCSHKCTWNIHSPLIRGWPVQIYLTYWRKISLKSTTWSYKVHWTSYFLQANLSRDSTRILLKYSLDLLKYSPNLPKFAELVTLAFSLRGGGPVYPAPVSYAYWNYFKFIEAVDMIFFIHTTRICAEECKIEKAAVVIACSLRNVSSMLDPGLVSFSRKIVLMLSAPVISPKSRIKKIF